jgi:uncharacterized membrane protein YdjX (TVP38/TMEM64 family)
LTIVGASIGASASFWIARSLGRAQVERIAGERAMRLDGWLRRRGFLAVLYARLIPAVPFNLLNYVAGATGVSARDYTLATIIGIAPGTVAYTALGSSLRHPGSGRFLIPLGAIVLLSAAVTVRERSRARRPRNG